MQVQAITNDVNNNEIMRQDLNQSLTRGHIDPSKLIIHLYFITYSLSHSLYNVSC